MLTRVSIAAPDANLQRRLRRLLAGDDVLLHSPRRDRRVWDRMLHEGGDVVIVARQLVPEPALESLATLRSLPEAPEIVVLCNEEDPVDSARLVAGGAGAVVTTNLPDDLLRNALTTVIERRRHELLTDVALHDQAERPHFSDFMSRSPRMQTFMGIVEKVSRSDSTLLIVGETGVGKEHLARAIHAEGPRAGGPFIAINCGALSETLLESELFGHEEGAFTGATRTRRGWFELAHRGTIFLDEIAEMPLHLQVKLLRVLQSREVQRVGGDSTISVDVRVMAATNRELEELRDKRFRPDLYYRLSVVTLTLPPLRERRADIPGIVRRYIHHFQGRFATLVEGIDDAALTALQDHAWPGNVRELINVIERAMLLSDGPLLVLGDLVESIRADGGSESSADDADAAPGSAAPLAEEWLDLPLREVKARVVEDVERRYLEALLRATGGRVGETAERAGIQPRSLFDKMKHHGLRKEDFRPARRSDGLRATRGGP